MAVPHLPVIAVDQSGAEEVKEVAHSKKPKSVAFSNVQLGSFLRQPQPGDPYLSPRFSSKPRPLGLIPGKNDRLTALKKLNQLLSPWKPEPTVISRPSRATILPKVNQQENKSAATPTSSSSSALPLVVIHNDRVNALDTSVKREEAKYRRQLLLAQEARLRHPISTREVDPDYMEVADKTIMKYCDTPRQTLPSNQGRSFTSTDKFLQVHIHESRTQNKKQSHWKRYSDPGKSSLQYFNFTGQAHLNYRSLMDDRRQAADHELCERCRLRGTRCARCLAIRTGGGYIIVDCEDDGLDALTSGRDGSGVAWKLGQSNLSGRGKRMRKAGKGSLDGEDGQSGVLSGDGSNDNLKDGLEGMGGGGVRTRDSMDNEAWRVKSRDGTDNSGRGLHGLGTAHSGKDGREGRFHGAGQDGDEDGSRSGHASNDRDSGHGGKGDDGGSDVWDDTGRQSSQGAGSRSRLLSARSRPGSTRTTRPGSSMKKYGRSLERKERGRTGADQERMSGRGQRQGNGEMDGDDGAARGRRSRMRRQDGDGSDEEEGADRDRAGLDYQVKKEDEKEQSKQGYRGNLMKYKKKKDDVKALHATLKELQGIDPLDYLARYCIIDQSKLPHYKHVFDNVDRDEDDEISVSELDFALKAVNYDLITDAEMNYVHSVLELAGRYRLNFQLFSLVAALSEKVVSLEDMVKHLINKMDFHALEVKMKKCKELFYLLADSDSVHEGGVVTTSSLGVELQAGGLTQEHVEYVVDRLNHQDRGLVEFLDYLTYVPLFVEIHDAIYGNPLDFSRTK